MSFWKHMVKKFPDLERGESASLTGRDHIPPRVFKEMTRLTKTEKANWRICSLESIPLTPKSRAEEICKILDTYIPSVEKMDTLLRKYGVAFTKTASENKKVENEKCRTGRISCIGAEGQHPKADRRPQAAARL